MSHTILRIRTKNFAIVASLNYSAIGNFQKDELFNFRAAFIKKGENLRVFRYKNRGFFRTFNFGGQYL